MSNALRQIRKEIDNLEARIATLTAENASKSGCNDVLASLKAKEQQLLNEPEFNMDKNDCVFFKFMNWLISKVGC